MMHTTSIKAHTLEHMHIQSNPYVVLLFVHCSLWQHIEGGGKLKYCIIGNLRSQIFMGTK